MNQIIIVNKKAGMTSRDVVNQLNRILNTKKIGHTGTLDPIAEGVLVVCTGKALKLSELLTATYKEYIAEIKLGLQTDTGDKTGQVIATQAIPQLKKEQIEKILNSFLGVSVQRVPIYSAVKVNGKKLYEYARNNEKVTLPTRKIAITNIKLLDYKQDIIKFQVTVSKGTYIRSLIQDICAKLQTIGTMNSLVRTKQGNFKIADSYTLNDIEKGEYQFLTIKDILKDYPQKNLTDREYQKVKNGALMPNSDNIPLTVYMYHNEIVAIYQIYEKDKTKKKPYRMFF